MTLAVCAVRHCMSSPRCVLSVNLKFHQFPSKDDKARVWIEACGRPELLQRHPNTWKSMIMCSRHFDKTMYTHWTKEKVVLKKNAIPTLLIPSKDTKSCKIQTEVITSTQASQTLRQRQPAREKFFKGCDRFLSPKLSAIAKADSLLKRNCKNKQYSRKFKLFCIKIYYSTPRAYRYLSKSTCLPSKCSLAKMDLIGAELNINMWTFLSDSIKHMSALQKECVLCMGGISLCHKLPKNGKQVISNKKRGGATYAFTLMLRGLVTDWKQLIGFTFKSSSNVEEQLKSWIISTAKRLFQIGFNLRVIVSDLRPDFLQFSKTLGISKEKTWFKIDGKTIYYIFDVPFLMKSVRNCLLNHNIEYNGKISQWVDIKNMYEIDKERKMRAAPRLTYDHISPNGFQKHNLRFSVQVFSDSVATALKNFELTGTVKLANGTIHFVKTMNDLFDLLNSSDIDPMYKPFKNDTSQKELLEKVQCMFDPDKLKVKKIPTGRDVTSSVRFIDGFNVTINSVRQLHYAVESDGYKGLFTRRLNNDYLEDYFTVLRQAKGGRRNPTLSQFTKAFVKTFMFQSFHLAEISNCTEDFDVIVKEYLECLKKPENPKMRLLGENDDICIEQSGTSLEEQHPYLRVHDMDEDSIDLTDLAIASIKEELFQC